MMQRTRCLFIWLVIAVTLMACAPAPTAGTSGKNDVATTTPAATKRITAAIRSVPASLVQQRTPRSPTVHGLDGIEELTHAGLTYTRADGTRAGQLAETVPTLDNGFWKLLPDGRMETTWQIKPTAKWHDGTAVTADDFLFTAAVEQDKELEIPPYAEYELIEMVTAPDPRTVVVRWARPYIEADSIFSYRAAGLPMPKHILERAVAEDKANFAGLPYWTDDFVGAGAYRVKSWVRDSHTILQAFDGYIFGRPKIDEIEVRFISDNNALTTYILAGGDLTLGKTISLDIAVQVRDNWTNGRVEVRPQNWTFLNPQFDSPDPPVVGDVRFRRAMLKALDREQTALHVLSGQGSIAHSYVNPDAPLYAVVDPAVVKYEYNPRAAAQEIEGLGYTKRPDGFFYDAAGRKLSVSLRASAQNDIQPKTMPVVADFWQQSGIAVEQEIVPPQRNSDREYRATFPSFDINERRNSLNVAEVSKFHSSQVPLPENRFRAAGVMRYRNPEVDALVDRFLTTIPLADRMQVMAALVHHQTENLAPLPLFYGADPTLISNRLINVHAKGDTFTQAWNIQEWDVKN
jgi:peptide/nickel transport system substrate-binding protein